MKSILVGKIWTEKKRSKINNKFIYYKKQKAICSSCEQEIPVTISNWKRTSEAWKCRKCWNKNPTNSTHKKSNTRLYKLWALLKRRTIGKKTTTEKKYYANSSIIDEWLVFDNFYNWSINNGYKDTLSLDRIDFSKGYSKENCRWVSDFIQAQNKDIMSTNTSGYTGVRFDENRNKWISRVTAFNKNWMKRFKTKEEAIVARNNKIREWGSAHPIQ